MKATDIETLSKSIQQLAELQHNQGSEWSVNGATFILISILVILCMGTVFVLLIKSVLNQQKQLTQKVFERTELLERFQSSFDKNTEVLKQVNDYMQKLELLTEEKAKQEATQSQIHFFVKSTLDAYKYKLSSSTLRIIKENNIINKPKTKLKISKLITNLFNNCVLSFGAFRYRGKHLGEELFDEDWKNSQISLVEEYIYSEQRDLHKFYADLDILFDTIFQEIRQKIGF